MVDTVTHIPVIVVVDPAVVEHFLLRLFGKTILAEHHGVAKGGDNIGVIFPF